MIARGSAPFLTIGFCSLAIVFQGLLGAWLFFSKAGISISSIGQYYAQKSLWGLLEVATPHSLAMTVSGFILGHFVLFLRRPSDRQKFFFALQLIALPIVGIALPFLIYWVSPALAILKIVTIIWLNGLYLWLAYSIIRETTD